MFSKGGERRTMALASAPRIRRSLPRRAKKSRPTPEGPIYPVLPMEIPVEMHELVLSRLPLHELFVVPWLSKAWRMTFTKLYFRRLLDEAHPKMIAIVGFLRQFRLTIAAFDFATCQWHYRLLRNPKYEFAWGYRKPQAFVAHDAGLLCFVPFNRKKACPIVVCNPLTNEWKTLPFPESKYCPWNPHLLRLKVDVTTRHYKVTVVHRCMEKQFIWHEAEVYDSATNLWSKKEDGVVCGQKSFLYEQFSNNYNCSRGKSDASFMLGRQFADLRPLQGAEFMTTAVRGQHIFKLSHQHYRDKYRVSEYARDDSGVEKEITSYDSSLQVISDPSDVRLTATERFLLLVADNCRVEGQMHRQQTIHVRDQVLGKWHELPALTQEYSDPDSGRRKKSYVVCELRWNATP